MYKKSQSFKQHFKHSRLSKQIIITHILTTIIDNNYKQFGQLLRFWNLLQLRTTKLMLRRACEKYKKVLYCQKDHQCEKGYVCHNFTTKGLASFHYTQRQVNECKVLQDNKFFENLSNSARNVEDGHLWYLFVTWQRLKSKSWTCGIGKEQMPHVQPFEQGVYVLEHLSYSLDQAPCDLFFFSLVTRISRWQNI